MGTYTRLGSYLLASELASDPFGTIQRAVAITGNTFDRHVLVRTFSEELLQAGVNTRLPEAGRVVPLLGGARIFGMGYRVESGKTPHVAWDYVPGRSLAQLIDKAKQEQIPFGVDHALTVIQGVAQGIVQMHAKGASHGLLSPHSVWVSFEGATQLVDAPFASLVRSMLAKAPSAMNKLASYLQGTDKDPLQQDLFALGAVLYELLTFERLPVGGSLQAVLDKATLKAAQEEVPFPAELRALLGRLLLGRQPFLTVEGFHAELERVLYEGEYSPTTFNMAFFMHTLFREENDRDAAAMKVEEGDNYLAYTAAGESMRSGATRVDYMDSGIEPPPKSNSMLLVGGGLAALVILGFGYFFLSRPKEDPALQKQLAELQILKTQMEQQKAEVDAKAKAQNEKTVQLQKQLTETKSADEKLKIEKQLEESRQRRLDLERQQKAAVQKLAEQRLNEQRLNEQRRASVSKPAGLPPPPPPPPQVTEIPRPQQPVPEPPKVAAAPSQAAQQSAPGGAAPISEAARILEQVPPVYPQRAIQSHTGTNQDQRVRLKVFVNERGQVLKVSLIEGVGGTAGFDEAAVEAANKSSFSAATRDGKPARGWTPEIVYNFKKR